MPNLCDGIGVIDGDEVSWLFQRIVLSLLFSSLKDNFCEKDELIGVKLSLVRSMKLFKDNSCEKMLSLSNALSLIKRNMLTKDNPRYLTTYSERL